MMPPIELPNQVEKPNCALHVQNRDHNWTVEDHHIIPQAWQAVFIPPNAHLTPAPQPTMLGEPIHRSGLELPRALWDARTITLAPTCHRNVHFWLVVTMKAYATIPRGMADDLNILTPEAVRLESAFSIVKAAYKLRGVQAREHGVATSGLSRFMQAGGSLDLLVDRKEWGQA